MKQTVKLKKSINVDGRTVPVGTKLTFSNESANWRGLTISKNLIPMIAMEQQSIFDEVRFGLTAILSKELKEPRLTLSKIGSGIKSNDENTWGIKFKKKYKDLIPIVLKERKSYWERLGLKVTNTDDELHFVNTKKQYSTE